MAVESGECTVLLYRNTKGGGAGAARLCTHAPPAGSLTSRRRSGEGGRDRGMQVRGPGNQDCGRQGYDDT